MPQFKVIKPHGKLVPGDVVTSTSYGVSGYNVLHETKGKSFGVPKDCLEAIPEESASAEQPPPQQKPVEKPVELVKPQEVPPPQPEHTQLAASLGASLLTPMDRQGRILRLFCVPRLVPDDMVRLVRASEDFMLATGDQSLGEALSAGKKFYYECNTHKQLLLLDLLEVSQGLNQRHQPARNPNDFFEQTARYFLALKAARKDQGLTANEHCAERMIDACFPPRIDDDAVIFVTCKDAGGQGDITNARKQRTTLKTTFNAKNVFLVMAKTARDQAIGAGEKPEDVWLVADGNVTEEMDIRNWHPKSRKVHLIQAAAPLNKNMVSIIESAVTAQGGAFKETVLLEYGYSQYEARAQYSRDVTFRDSMGMGPSEFGFLVHRELRAYREAGWPKSISGLNELKLAELTKSLFSECTPGEYPAHHRLYTGYSHYNGEKFVKLVAHLERALAEKAPPTKFIDVVCVGNTFRLKTWISKYDGLLKELRAGGGPDLSQLGIQYVEVFNFFKDGDQEKNPYTLQQERFEVQDPKPKEGLPSPEMDLTGFLKSTTPNVFKRGFPNEPLPVGRAAYEAAGVWLASGQSHQEFEDLSDVLCVARNFDFIFGGRLNRGSLPSVPAKITMAKTKLIASGQTDDLVEKLKELNKLALQLGNGQ
jgi:hypothetical protein